MTERTYASWRTHGHPSRAPCAWRWRGEARRPGAGRARRRLGQRLATPRQAHRRPHPARRTAGALALLRLAGRRHTRWSAGRGGPPLPRGIEVRGIGGAPSASRRRARATPTRRTAGRGARGRASPTLGEARPRLSRHDQGSGSLRRAGPFAGRRRAQVPRGRCLTGPRPPTWDGPVGTAWPSSRCAAVGLAADARHGRCS